MAANLYYWHGMTQAIDNMVRMCDKCQMLRPSLPVAPLQNHPEARFPMQEVGVDLFQIGDKHYLAVVDRYSGYPFVFFLQKLDTSAVCDVLLKIFYEVGFPQYVQTDGGPQFRSEFLDFCSKYHICLLYTSPSPRDS